MINDYLFEMSDSDLNPFEMIYLLSFRNDRKNFRTQNYFVNRIGFGHQTAEMET